MNDPPKEMEVFNDDHLQLIFAFVQRGSFFICAFVAKNWMRAWTRRDRTSSAALFLDSPRLIDYAADVGAPLSALMAAAVARNHRAAMSHLLDRSQDLHRQLCCLAAAAGDLGLLQWAHGEMPWRWPVRGVRRRALLGGHLNVIDWLRTRTSWREGDWSLAARGGHLHVLRWVRNLYGEGAMNKRRICFEAALGGQLHVLRWVDDRYYMRHEHASYGAACGRRLETLRWLRENHYGSVSLALVHAAERGNLEAIKWLYGTCGAELTEEVFSTALAHGRLAVLRWLLEHGCPWDQQMACLQAAFRGRLDVLQWLREVGAPWDSRICSVATCPDMLTWIHESCEWHGDSCDHSRGSSRLARRLIAYPDPADYGSNMETCSDISESDSEPSSSDDDSD